jgi:sec-independent protein translocase protein TatA
MAFGDPIQWVIIGVIVIVIFLWGPQKIPDIARAIGRAKKEFDQASKEVGDAASMTSKPSTAAVPAASVASSIPVPEKTGDQMLVETARKLGITVEGKSRDQISQEIVDKVNSQK